MEEASCAVHEFGFAWFLHHRPQKLVLTGPSGCGKTALARALFRWANASAMSAWGQGQGPWGETFPRVDFLRWQETSDLLEGAKSSMVEILGDAIAHSMLVIDDIGAESDRFKSGKAIDALGYLLTRRQDFGFTMLTTNIPQDGWKDKWDARVADRLLRDSTIIDMSQVPSWSTVKQ